MKLRLAIALLTLSVSAEVWEFQTPPAATRSFDVDFDWRKRAGARLIVRHIGDLPSEPVLCSLFFIAKDDILVKQRHPLYLNGESQDIELPFDDGHWRCANARRPLDSDLLHHIRSWGIEIFCPVEHSGSLSFGEFKPIGVRHHHQDIWRQDYAVVKAPGWAQAKLIAQGTPLREASKVEMRAADLKGLELPKFNHKLAKSRVLALTDGAWADSDIDRAWAARLDWTPAWGHYRGLGHFDQKIAWQLEQVLLRYNGEPRPIFLFDDDELDDQGRFNWQDHPENQANGGPLRRPLDQFRANSAEQVVLRRARFLWSRFGHLPAVNGLLIDAIQPEPVALDWIAKIAKALPDTPLFSTNPELLPRADVHIIPVADMPWRIDPELSNGEIETQHARAGIELRSSQSSSIGVVARRPLHWQTADSLMIDASSPAREQDEVKAVCIIRPDDHTVFQSRVRLMREGEMNRLVFSLTDPREWTCLQDPDRKFDPAALLNVPEMGMRFFQDEPGPLLIHLANILVQQPYEADLAKRPALAIENLLAPDKEIPTFERYELRFDLNRAFRNPYDPNEIDVSIRLTAPDGSTLGHPGFYMEPRSLPMKGEYERPTPDGAAYWCVRVSPHQVGDYSWTVTAQAGAESATVEGKFTAVKGERPGIIRVSEKDPRYFEFSDGSLFFPIGQNVRSPGDSRLAKSNEACGANAAWAQRVGTRAYEKWFSQMAKHGANFARVWMSPWWLGLEWNQDYDGQHGLTYYSQDHAARLDRIIELAEEHGIYVNLETSNHGAFSIRIDPEWEHNPFNRQHNPDGFLSAPSDVFLSERGREYVRRRQRYTVARWGYSNAIAWWGVITEGEWVEPYDRTIPWEKEKQPPLPSGSLAARLDPMDNRAAYFKWMSDSAKFLRHGGAHGHLASMHFSNPCNGKMVWQDPNLSVVHNNAYTMFSRYSIFWENSKFGVSRGVADVIPALCYEYRKVADEQPLVIGEWGGHPAINKVTHLQTEFHTGNWSLLMTRSAGAAGFWWWNLVDAADLYPTFSAVRNFMKGEDPRGWSTTTRHCQLRLQEPPPPDWPFWRDALIRCGTTKLWGYVYSHAINTHKSSVPPKAWDDADFDACGIASVRIPERLEPGNYKIEYWDTFAGKPVGSANVKITEDHHWIPIRDHHVDVAFKMTPTDEEASVHTPPPPPKPEPEAETTPAKKLLAPRVPRLSLPRPAD